jgi:hypothetical protein
MRSFFLPLFSISSKTYTYNLPIEAVRSKIDSVFNESTKFFSSVDINARFVRSNEFIIETVTGAYSNGANPSLRLRGVLNKANPQTTTITIFITPASIFKILFWLSIIIGIVMLSQEIFKQSLTGVGAGLLVLFLGPFLIVKFSAISNASVEERYHLFIHKILSKAND